MQDLNNSQKNAIRSIVAFATSEALSKAFEKELDVLEKVKTFIKIGQTVYKVVLWYDEHSNSYKTDSKKHQTNLRAFTRIYSILNQSPCCKRSVRKQNLSFERRF